MFHSKHPSVAHVLTNLGATWRNLGDSMKSKELFEKALAIQEELYEPYHPAVSSRQWCGLSTIIVIDTRSCVYHISMDTVVARY